MWLYNLVVRSYGLVIKLASVFGKQKAIYWVKGRKNWRNKLTAKINAVGSAKTVWMHCASLGEFEQGRPLIEAIKRNHPEYKVVLSFFSPSGYEVTKNYDQADVIAYLPLDTKQNAADFLQIINPAFIVFVRYEFWLNYLFEIKKRDIPCYLISAVFKEHHPFFKWYGWVFKKSLGAFKTIFVQEENSARLLDTIGIHHVEVSGDTRNDRVLAIREKLEPINGIAEFKNGSRLIVAGSTWPKDEDVIIKAFCELKKETNVKLLIAPHEIDKATIDTTVRKLKEAGLRYSIYQEGVAFEHDVLVLNTMGMLSKVYQYAEVAYVGGGMHTDGIHNILEPSVYLIPVCFGGKADYEKYPEAVSLNTLGTAVIIMNERELYDFWKKSLNNSEYRQEVVEKLSLFFERNGNVTQRLLKSMKLLKSA
jgi:3-deoxy-D-manno-octulosonic-acid transferase